MVGKRSYDFIYRHGAPWDDVGVREDLVRLLESHSFPTGSRSVDLGCGTGANVVHLARLGFEAVGVDFSPVALEKARERAGEKGVLDKCRFVEADLTLPPDPSLGTFDLLTDFGSLDDLRQRGRRAMARTVGTLARPGGLFLLWGFHGDRSELPWFTFQGPSKLYPGLVPREAQALFESDFELVSERIEPGHACFIFRRR